MVKTSRDAMGAESGWWLIHSWGSIATFEGNGGGPLLRKPSLNPDILDNYQLVSNLFLGRIMEKVVGQKLKNVLRELYLYGPALRPVDLDTKSQNGDGLDCID